MMIPDIDDLSYIECYECKNFFYVYELPNSLNDPVYCAYCGIKFNQMMDISDE